MVTIDAKILASALAWATRAVPAKSTYPVLTTVRVACRDDRLRVCGFDYELFAAVTAGAVGDLDPVHVNAAMLAKAAGKLTGDVTLTHEGTELQVANRRTSFTLPSVFADDYPPLPALPAHVGVCDQLQQVIGLTFESAARSDTRPILAGAHVWAADGTLRVTASDRYQASFAAVPWAGADFDVVVPVRRLGAFVKDVSGALDLYADDRQFGIGNGTVTASTVLLDGAFPQIEQLLDDTLYTDHATVPVGALRQGLDVAGLTLDPGDFVTLGIKPGLILINGSGEQARAYTEVEDVDYDGAPFTALYDPSLLGGCVSRVATSRVQLSWSMPDRPLRVTGYDPGTDTIDPTIQHVMQPIVQRR